MSDGVPYKATQSVYLLPLLLAVAAVATGLWAAATGEVGAVVVWIALGLAAVLSLVFSRLTVLVGKGQVLAEFGPGRPRRRYRLDEVTGIEQVRNKWWYGWGLRWIPNGSMYNVWGLDAVELRLASGKVFRIGTDEPAALRAALEAEQARVATHSMPDAADDEEPAE